MSLSIGIVGLPNAGKSSLFKALTAEKVLIGKYPFTTIEPHHGIVSVPDERLQNLAKLTPQNSVLPATIEFVDIAGLVEGSHRGEGLGNQFLSHIRETAALIEVVRSFADESVPHPGNTIDPERDIKIIDSELILADLESCKRGQEKWQAKARSQDKEALAINQALSQATKVLEGGNSLGGKISRPEEEILGPFRFLTLKPIIFVLNISENTKIDTNRFIPLALKFLAEVAELDKKEAKLVLQDFGFSENPITGLIQKAFGLLDLINFYTIKPPETRAWLVARDTPLAKAGGKIHTDFEEKFIRAEVINARALLEIGSWQQAKTLGKVRTESKEYLVKDGDVVEFKI